MGEADCGTSGLGSNSFQRILHAPFRLPNPSISDNFSVIVTKGTPKKMIKCQDGLFAYGYGSIPINRLQRVFFSDMVQRFLDH